MVVITYFIRYSYKNSYLRHFNVKTLCVFYVYFRHQILLQVYPYPRVALIQLGIYSHTPLVTTGQRYGTV